MSASTEQGVDGQSPGWQEAYVQAWLFAAQAHGGQTMPGDEGLSYLTHVGLVAMEVMASLVVEPLAEPVLALQCALLHDVVEDTTITVEDVAQQFGPEVAAGVAALTKSDDFSKGMAMADSLQRIREQPHAVWRVKLADRITNLLPPPAHWSRNKRVVYRDEARVILAALAQASPMLAKRLDDRITAYGQYCEA